ncbi:NTP transferase domain-containing protein [Candidatus Woesearchaeota archaeon]|nr:NTP transferase domain-containing protein [Candidatus Woesearchaeota archaeon]
MQNTSKFLMSTESANAGILSKAVILVAGKSTRTYPLTCTRPKALLKVANKTILEIMLDNLPKNITEIFLIVNYKKEMIQETFKSHYKNIKINYVEQKETKGTGHALLQAEQFLKNEDNFLVMIGDDYFSAEDLAAVSKHASTILAQEVEHPEWYGVLTTNAKNELVGIEEKPAKPKTNLVNTGVYVLSKEIFPLLAKVKKSKRGEYELTDAINIIAKTKPIAVVKAKDWQPMTYPWHLLDVNKKLLNQVKFKNDGKIEQGVTIHGAVEIGKGTILKSGTYIEGPVLIGENCTIGPNCYIRADTSLGNKVKIGNAVEVKNCVVGDHTSIGHLSYVGDSVIGEHVNFGAGTIAANLRHDDQTVKSQVGKNLVDSGRRKLGAIIGDHVHTGVHTSIYPGRKLWPHAATVPGEAVKKDKE